MGNQVKKIIIVILLLIYPTLIAADTIILKDGQTFTGKLISRTDSAVVFEIGGQQMNFPLSNVQNVSVDFNAAPQTSSPAPAQEQAPAPVPEKPKVLQVQAGTPMTISLATPLDSGKHASGHRFTATLEAN